MKKKAILLFIILPVLLCSFCHASQITASLISQNLDVSIVVDGPPTLVIHEPRNVTYTTNESLLLNFTVIDGDVVYNLDNGNNISIPGFIYFNTTEGAHVMKVFANNSIGITEKTVYFSVSFAVPPPVQAPSAPAPTHAPEKQFTVEPSKILIQTVKDAPASETIKITNQQKNPILINVDMGLLSSIKTYPASDMISFSLNPGESKEFEIGFNTSETGIYASKIVVTGNGFTAEIPVTLIVEKYVLPAQPAPFKTSVFITLPKAGQLFKINTLLYNVTVSGEGTITYQIKDFEGDIIWESSEPIAIKEGMLSKEALLTGIMPGDYVVSASVLYEGNVIISAKEFTIPLPQPMIPPGISDIIVIATIVIAIIAIGYSIFGKILKKKRLKSRFILKRVQLTQ